MLPALLFDNCVCVCDRVHHHFALPTMHVAVCRSVLQCVTVCYGMLQRVVNSVLCQPIRIYAL